jgi:hypothetical protein
MGFGSLVISAGRNQLKEKEKKIKIKNKAIPVTGLGGLVVRC